MATPHVIESMRICQISAAADSEISTVQSSMPKARNALTRASTMTASSTPSQSDWGRSCVLGGTSEQTIHTTMVRNAPWTGHHAMDSSATLMMAVAAMTMMADIRSHFPHNIAVSMPVIAMMAMVAMSSGMFGRPMAR